MSCFRLLFVDWTRKNCRNTHNKYIFSWPYMKCYCPKMERDENRFSRVQLYPQNLHDVNWLGSVPMAFWIRRLWFTGLFQVLFYRWINWIMSIYFAPCSGKFPPSVTPWFHPGCVKFQNLMWVMSVHFLSQHSWLCLEKKLQMYRTADNVD